jgi:hypothetical protein
VRLGDNRAIAAVLGSIPDSVDAREHDGGVEIRWRGGHAHVVPLWIGEGFPSDLSRSEIDDREATVITARRLSPRVRAELTAAGRSWADATGHLHIEAPGLLLDRGATATRSRRDVRWSPSTGAVVEAVIWMALERTSSEPLSAADIAELTGISYPQVNKILQQMEGAHQIRKTGSERGTSARRYVHDPSGLLSEWAGWYRTAARPAVQFHTVQRETDEILQALDRAASIDWVLTDWVASDVIAPLSTLVPNVACYVPEARFESMRRSLIAEGLEQVESGGRLAIIPAGEAVFAMAETVHGMRVVSPVRLYGDLIRQGGRGEDAAEHLREVALGF